MVLFFCHKTILPHYQKASMVSNEICPMWPALDPGQWLTLQLRSKNLWYTIQGQIHAYLACELRNSSSLWSHFPELLVLWWSLVLSGSHGSLSAPLIGKLVLVYSALPHFLHLYLNWGHAVVRLREKAGKKAVQFHPSLLELQLLCLGRQGPLPRV